MPHRYIMSRLRDPGLLPVPKIRRLNPSVDLAKGISNPLGY
jgi:hypothetical protein